MCPVCHSKDIKKTIYLYNVCASCSSLYLTRMPPASYIEKAIEEYGNSAVVESADIKLLRVHKKRLQDLSAYLKPGAKIIDIGCGYGQFIQLAKSDGYEAEAMDKAKACVKRIQKLGIPAYTDLNKVPNSSYNAVTMFDVIEHVPDPVQFLEQIYKKLKKDGVLMVTTPNITGITAKVVPSLFTWAPGDYTEHIVLFTMSSLSNILTDNFTILNKTTDTLMNWCYSENMLFRKIINKLIYTLSIPVQPLLFSHHLGDNIQIIARKK